MILYESCSVSAATAADASVRLSCQLVSLGVRLVQNLGLKTRNIDSAGFAYAQ